MGESACVDSHGSHQRRRLKGSLDDRGRQPELTASAGRDERITADWHRNRCGRLSVQRLHRQAREWAQCDISRRTKAVPGVVGSGCGEVRWKKPQEAQEAQERAVLFCPSCASCGFFPFVSLGFHKLFPTITPTT